MPALIGSDLPTIAQAIETQLLTRVSPITGNTVAGDISNIYWIFSKNETPPPGTTGERDLLFEFDDDFTENQIGDGRLAATLSGLYVYLRTSTALDRAPTKKDWFLTHRPLVNALLDVLMGFRPLDSNSNMLTVEGLVSTRNRGDKSKDVVTWGYTIAEFQFHYITNIDRTVIA